MKYYYAHYSQWGVMTTYDHKITGAVYAFTSRKERDEFVNNNEWNRYPNLTCRPIGRKEVEENYGRNFVIVSKYCGTAELGQATLNVVRKGRCL